MVTIRRMTAGPIIGPNPLKDPVEFRPNMQADTDLGVDPDDKIFQVNAARPMPWRFTMRPDPAKDPTSADFARVDPRSVIISSEDDMDTVLNEAWDCYGALESYVKDANILAGEADIWKKITVQRGWRTSRILVDMSPEDIDIPGLWVDTLKVVLKRYQYSFVEAPIPESPMDTNAGWPIFTTGYHAKAASALLYLSRDVEELHDLNLEFASRLSLPKAGVNGFGLNFRQGPRYKEEPFMQHAGAGMWTATHSYAGISPRARQVFMGPYGSAIALNELLRALQGGRRGIPGLWSAGDTMYTIVANADALGYDIREADISGYDLTVRRSIQRVVREQLIRQYPELRFEIDLWFYLEGRPVIGPAVDLGPGLTVWKTYGCTHSGIRLTSEIGTLITTTTALYALQKTGFPDAINQWKSGDLMLLISGDDILIGMKKLPSAEDWAAAWMEVGFDCELSVGRRFLMKHRIGRRAIPVGGRIVQQTVSNEHEPTGKYASIISLLGLVARWDVGPPPEVVPLVDRVLRHTNVYTRWGLSSGAEAAKRLKQPDAQELLQDALTALANDPWMKMLVRDAPHRPSAAAELAILRQIGVNIEDESVGLSQILHRQLARFSPRKGMEKAIELWNATMEGGPMVDRAMSLMAAEEELVHG